jgi:hypothetical protein
MAIFCLPSRMCPSLPSVYCLQTHWQTLLGVVTQHFQQSGLRQATISDSDYLPLNSTDDIRQSHITTVTSSVVFSWCPVTSRTPRPVLIFPRSFDWFRLSKYFLDAYCTENASCCSCLVIKWRSPGGEQHRRCRFLPFSHCWLRKRDHGNVTLMRNRNVCIAVF